MDNKNWETYKVEIGWTPIDSSEVFSSSLLFKLLNDNLVYKNGELKFKE